MRRSERRNNLQICPRWDSNTGGSDLWSNTLPLDHGGALWSLWTQSAITIARTSNRSMYRFKLACWCLNACSWMIYISGVRNYVVSNVLGEHVYYTGFSWGNRLRTFLRILTGGTLVIQDFDYCLISVISDWIKQETEDFTAWFNISVICAQRLPSLWPNG